MTKKISPPFPEHRGDLPRQLKSGSPILLE
jgi:hypothetical protein